MVKTKKALTASIFSALLVGTIYFLCSSLSFVTIGIIMVISVFLIGFIGMKGKELFK